MTKHEKLESEGDPRARLAHQLNNSLLIIMGNLDLLAAEMADSGRMELLADALTATQDAARLVEQVRDLELPNQPAPG